MKTQIKNFLLKLAEQGYNIRWVQGLDRGRYIKMYDTQSGLELGRIEVTKENAGDLKDTEIGNLVREVKYPLLDPETLKKHIEGMVKVDPRYKKYEGLKEEVEQVKKEAKAVIKDAKEYLDDLSYEERAQQFLKDTKTTLTIVFKEFDIMENWGDKQPRDIYTCTLKNSNGSYTFDFGQSIAATEEGKEPTAYDILACMNIDYSEDFEDFCANFGYDTDSRAAERIYKAVVKEYNAMSRLLTEEELEQLHEIQ